MKKKLEGAAFGKGGDFHSPGQDLAGRIAFCWAVAEVEPRVLVRLEEDVYPIFCRNNPFHGEDNYAPDAVQALEIWHTAQASGVCDELSAALAGWQREFHLNDSWIRDEAVLALWRWHSAAEGVEGITFQHAWAPSYDFDARPLAGPLHSFLIPRWNVQTTSAIEYKAMVLALFEEALDSLITDERGRAERAGLVQTRRVRNRREQGKFSQYKWLARFQVQVMSYPQLVDHYEREYGKKLAPTRVTIETAIRVASTAIGLTRRSLTSSLRVGSGPPS